MRTVTLKAKSLKGKNRIREHGAVWTVEQDASFQGQPALLVSTVKDLRWVMKSNDPNFTIEE
jgi:hypothetical protein